MERGERNNKTPQERGTIRRDFTANKQKVRKYVLHRVTWSRKLIGKKTRKTRSITMAQI
jgi:hypothetical protein